MIIILGSIIAIAPLTIDMYLPSLLSIGAELHADATAVQLTLTGTLFGLAVGQLLIGPYSDAVGRRQPLLYGMALHVAASLLILAAPNVAVLGVLRVLQGLGAAAATVVATAVVRDLVTGIAAAKVISRLMLVLGAAPVLAPTLGSQLLRLTQWRGIFVALAVFGVAIGTMAMLTLPETLPPDRRQRGDLRSTVRSYRLILRDRTFIGLVLVASLGMAGVFSYVAGSSFVLQQQFGLSAQQFGLVFGAGAVGLVAVSQLNVRLLSRYGPRQISLAGLVWSSTGVLLLVALTATHTGGLVGLLIPLWMALTGVGLVMPNASAMALSRHGEAAGTAAAVVGFLQFGVGAVAAPLVGALGATGLAMAAVMAASLLGALASMLFVVRPADVASLDPTEAAVAPA
jgi:DHA1 family bicyclomycin/chloramphenicol resistance-like MFS transporter